MVASIVPGAALRGRGAPRRRILPSSAPRSEGARVEALVARSAREEAALEEEEALRPERLPQLRRRALAQRLRERGPLARSPHPPDGQVGGVGARLPREAEGPERALKRFRQPAQLLPSRLDPRPHDPRAP